MNTTTVQTREKYNNNLSVLLAKITEKRQAECEHMYQDRITTAAPGGIFCGTCGLQMGGDY